jgi:hypothetical protein
MRSFCSLYTTSTKSEPPWHHHLGIPSFLLKINVNNLRLWLFWSRVVSATSGEVPLRLPYNVSTACAANYLILVTNKLPLASWTSPLSKFFVQNDTLASLFPYLVDHRLRIKCTKFGDDKKFISSIVHITHQEKGTNKIVNVGAVIRVRVLGLERVEAWV